MTINTLAARIKQNASIPAFIILAFIILPVRNGYILRWFDEMSLFEQGPVFLDRMLHCPGGILQYAGTWLTQFMYYPWAGSSILIVLWTVLAILCMSAFSIDRKLHWLSLLPPLSLLASVLSLDEAWVSLNFTGYLFAPTLGAICSVAIVWGASKMKSTVARVIFLTACPLMYPLLGFFVLIGVIAAIINVMVQGRMSSRDLLYLLPAVMLAVTPQIYYHTFPGTTIDNDYLYLRGLPVLMMESYDVYLWIPFIGLTLSMLLLPFARLAVYKRSTALVTAAAVLAAGVYCIDCGRKSEHFRATVLMMQHMDAMRWDKIVHIMRQIKEKPTFSMDIIGNLALLKFGMGKENLEHTIEDVNRDNPRKKEEFLMTSFINVPVYYHLGYTHNSYRWAMEHHVKYGTRAFYLKYLVRNSILHGEYKLASKYNSLLLGTIFHRRWAEHFQKYIDNPELIKNSPEFSAIPSRTSQSGFTPIEKSYQ